MQQHPEDMSDAEFERWLDALAGEPPDDSDGWRLVEEAEATEGLTEEEQDEADGWAVGATDRWQYR